MLKAKHLGCRFRAKSNDVSGRRPEVNMLGARKATNHDQSRYARHADFCRIFEQDMNRLYLLSFLLTGDHSLAEKCFVRGFSDSTTSNPVFVQWAEAWAVRKIVQNAIEMVHPRLRDGSASNSARNTEHAMTEPAEIAQILALPAFDRFVFVMSVLERYSDQECTVLLDCNVAELAAARIRAMEQIGNSAEHYQNTIRIGPQRVAQAERD